MKKQRKYTITITQTQAEVMNRALELYSRLKAGQLTELYFEFMNPAKSSRELFEVAAKDMKRSLWPDMEYNASKGIGQDTIESNGKGDIAWDMHEVLRHRLAWDKAGNPSQRDFKTMMGHDYDKPYSWSGHPLAEIKEVKT